MIHSTTKTDSVPRPLTIAGKPTQNTQSAPAPTDTEKLSASSTENLKSLLRSHPEVRPEIVSNAQKLAVDANYPPKELIRRLSELLVRSVDLSE